MRPIREEDGSTNLIPGWILDSNGILRRTGGKKPIPRRPTLRFNPDVKLDASQIQDFRGTAGPLPKKKKNIRIVVRKRRRPTR